MCALLCCPFPSSLRGTCAFTAVELHVGVQDGNINITDDAEAPLLFVEARSLESMRARTHWHLAYTLIHNPELKAHRVRVASAIELHCHCYCLLCTRHPFLM